MDCRRGLRPRRSPSETPPTGFFHHAGLNSAKVIRIVRSQRFSRGHATTRHSRKPGGGGSSHGTTCDDLIVRIAVHRARHDLAAESNQKTAKLHAALGSGKSLSISKSVLVERSDCMSSKRAEQSINRNQRVRCQEFLGATSPIRGNSEGV